MADQLMLLIEGAYCLGNTLDRDNSPVASVIAAAEALISKALSDQTAAAG
ncbi:hypothetical protein K678_14257 [Magnetospirillum fulvum MGU-K5]|uniref:Uncharacterized protein n=1 Tax=Magnetospirillum fulvum MGU-K5 TaxID=1316936 RepID=S9S9R7_MAGFU|nr:hypothetical protein K678_14257 [Magnetospirillum fulvum MGU-K5]